MLWLWDSSKRSNGKKPSQHDVLFFCKRYFVFLCNLIILFSEVLPIRSPQKKGLPILLFCWIWHLFCNKICLFCLGSWAKGWNFGTRTWCCHYSCCTCSFRETPGRGCRKGCWITCTWSYKRAWEHLKYVQSLYLTFYLSILAANTYLRLHQFLHYKQSDIIYMAVWLKK